MLFLTNPNFNLNNLSLEQRKNKLEYLVLKTKTKEEYLSILNSLDNIDEMEMFRTSIVIKDHYINLLKSENKQLEKSIEEFETVLESKKLKFLSKNLKYLTGKKFKKTLINLPKLNLIFGYKDFLKRVPIRSRKEKFFCKKIIVLDQELQIWAYFENLINLFLIRRKKNKNISFSYRHLPDIFAVLEELKDALFEFNARRIWGLKTSLYKKIFLLTLSWEMRRAYEFNYTKKLNSNLDIDYFLNYLLVTIKIFKFQRLEFLKSRFWFFFLMRMKINRISKFNLKDYFKRRSEFFGYKKKLYTKLINLFFQYYYENFILCLRGINYGNNIKDINFEFESLFFFDCFLGEKKTDFNFYNTNENVFALDSFLLNLIRLYGVRYRFCVYLNINQKNYTSDQYYNEFVYWLENYFSYHSHCLVEEMIEPWISYMKNYLGLNFDISIVYKSDLEEMLNLCLYYKGFDTL